MAQVTTTTKPANKTASKGASKPAAKSAKPAAKSASKPAEAPVSNEVKFHLVAGVRPSSGGLMFAHTLAFLRASGLIEGGSIPAATARKVLGDTAVTHHTKKTAQMILDGASIKLSPTGGNYFSDRPSISPADVDAYREILTTGKPDGRLVKVDWGVKAI